MPLKNEILPVTILQRVADFLPLTQKRALSQSNVGSNESVLLTYSENLRKLQCSGIPFFKDLFNFNNLTNLAWADHYDGTKEAGRKFHAMMRILHHANGLTYLELDTTEDIINQLRTLQKSYLNKIVALHEGFARSLRDERLINSFISRLVAHGDTEGWKLLLDSMTSSKSEGVQFELANVLFKANQIEEGERIISEISEPSTPVLFRTPHVFKERQGWAQIELALALLARDEMEAAIRTIEGISYSDYRAMAQCKVAIALFLTDKIVEGKRIIEKISSPFYKALAQIELVKVLPTEEEIAYAKKLSSELSDDEDFRARAQIALASVLPTTEEIVETNRLIHELYDFPQGRTQFRTRVYFVKKLVENGHYEKAKAIVSSNEIEPNDRVAFHVEYVKAMIEKGEFEEVKKFVEATFLHTYEGARWPKHLVYVPVPVKRLLIKILVKEGNVREAENMVYCLNGPTHKTVLLEYVEALISSEMESAAEEFIRRNNLGDEGQVYLSKILVLKGNMRGARAVIEQMTDPTSRLKAEMAFYETAFLQPSLIKFPALPSVQFHSVFSQAAVSSGPEVAPAEQQVGAATIGT